MIIFIIIFAFSFLFIGCNKKEVEKVSTVSLESFDKDSEDVYELLDRKMSMSNLVDFTNEERGILENYKEKYDRNPRLNNDQWWLENNIVEVYANYQTYIVFKDDADSNLIKLANESVVLAYDYLRKVKSLLND